VGFGATVVGKANLEVKIRVDVEGNLSGYIERRSESLNHVGSTEEDDSESQVCG
jgi:hypothetical protein